jgi:hypothetical protein
MHVQCSTDGPFGWIYRPQYNNMTYYNIMLYDVGR